MIQFLGLLAALAVSTALGVVLLRVLLPSARSGCELLVRAALAVGLGTGVSSCLYFLWLVLPLGGVGGLLLLELAVLAAGAAWCRKRQRPSEAVSATTAPTLSADRGSRWLAAAAIGLAGLSALYAFAFVVRRQPHGGWDAMAMFNSRARFFYRGGEHWIDAFQISGWFHPDYPALVPGAVARLWTYANGESTLEPVLVAFLFASATVVLLVGVLAERRGLLAAALACLLVCGLRYDQYGSDAFVLLAAVQYADVPLAFFVLATASLTLWRATPRFGAFAAAGVAASLGAWTKNEGLLLVVVLFAATAVGALLFAGRMGALHRLGAAVLGASPVLAGVMAFKVWIAPPNEIVSSSNTGILDKIADPSRYAEIATQVGDALLLYGGGAMVALMLALLILGPRHRGERAANAFPAWIAIGMVAGYLAVYVITPHELEWHVNSSKFRLLTQLWPTMLLAGFMLAARPDGARASVDSGSIRAASNLPRQPQ